MCRILQDIWDRHEAEIIASKFRYEFASKYKFIY